MYYALDLCFPQFCFCPQLFQGKVCCGGEECANLHFSEKVGTVGGVHALENVFVLADLVVCVGF